MLIQKGYWNYYLAFRIENYQTHILEMEKKKDFSGLIAFIADDNVLKNINIEELLKQRRTDVQKSKEMLTGDESYEKLYDLYKTDKLPEYFFDFDCSMNDLLNKQIEENISQVQFANHGYHQVLHSFGEGKCSYYVLMPLKIYFSDWKYEYCLVYIQLLTNGNGVIKLEVPLENIPAEFFYNYPMRRWFSYIKVWDPLFSNSEDNSYKIVMSDSEGIQDVITTLTNYVKNIFSESIVDENRFTGFETFVLSECSDCDIINANKNNERCLKEIYHFIFPENFSCTPNKEELRQFWNESHFNANGIHIIKGNQARLIMYANVSELMHQNGRNTVECKNSYLQASIAGTFDPFIILALAQKDNEISIYRMSEHDRHAINKNMTQYYANANYLDGMLIDAPKHGIDFYHEVQKILNNFSVDFQEMLERMRHIEEYEKLRLNEKQTTLLNRFTLIFTVLFGLPLIQDTLYLLKQVFNMEKDIIPIITISQVSFLIWVLLLFYMLTDNIDYYLEYEGVRIKEKSSLLARVKKMIILISGWLFLRKNKD